MLKTRSFAELLDAARNQKHNPLKLQWGDSSSGEFVITEGEMVVLINNTFTKSPTSEEYQMALYNCRAGRATFYGLRVVLVTHFLKEIKVNSMRKDWDFDMELTGGVWEIKWHVVCPRCKRRYRGGHHWLGKCRKTFSDDEAALMSINR